MLKKIKSIFSRSKKSLFTFNNEPFSIFSIILIIFLDIFLLVTILNGISSEKHLSPDVSIKYPSSCQMHFKNSYSRQLWENGHSEIEKEKFPFISYDAFYENKMYEFSSVFKDISADICIELNSKIIKFSETKEFKNNKKLLDRLQNKKRNILSDIKMIEQRYNTSLFEKSAKIKSRQMETQKRKYYNFLEKEKNIDRQIAGIKRVSEYKGYKDYVTFVNKNRKKFKKEFASYSFWQPFYSFMYLLKFTLPLLLLSFLGYKWSRRIGTESSVPRRLVQPISSHIILISAIPIFFNIMYLIYHVIPHRFLEKVIGFLYAFGMMFLGYYFLMFMGIVFFGGLIFLIQRGVSRREKARRELKEKRLYIDSYTAGKCPVCKNKADYSNDHCGNCGEELKMKCFSCKKTIPKNIPFCLHCGENQKK